MQSHKKSMNEIQQKINTLIDSYFQLKNKEKTSSLYPLVTPTFGSDEVKEAVDSLLTTFVTMGKKCAQFETDFANYVGVKHGLFVNSGSTANLIALSILSSPKIPNAINPGEEIITSAVTWSTPVFPIYDIGAIPVFIDSDPETMTLNIDQIEDVISDKTKAIMPVHLLGNPCDMNEILRIANEYKLHVIEDCCEAHGAKIGDRMIGSFGHLNTFSFFFSHHISTIEGGMILTDNTEFYQIGKSLRAHGWIRERDDQKSIIKKNPNYDPRFLFIHRGFNVRPTEIQGAFGIHQLPKLENFIQTREMAALFLNEHLEKYRKYIHIPKIIDKVRQSWFGYSIIVKQEAPFTRNELSKHLENNGVETRPIMGGNFVEQPIMSELKYRASNSLPNSQHIFHNGIFIGLHHKLEKNILKKIVKIFNDFFDNYI